MVTSTIKERIPSDIRNVWDLVMKIDNYGTWRSDISRAEVIDEKQFIEYTKEGYSTTFTITTVEPYRRLEFDMDNRNMKGHWIGILIAKGAETEIDFTEYVTAKKVYMKPFVKSYLKRQQARFIKDLKEAVAHNVRFE